MNIRDLGYLKGKVINSASVIDNYEDEKTGAYREILVIRFDDGSRLIVKSWDYEDYVSGLDIKYVVEGEKK